jgi:thioester reductase-like protein
MPYHLLTGATGLLGSYLLADCLRTGQQMAVLVRPSRSQSAHQRVEAIIARWEKELGEFLPRPIVFEGDITHPDLDLDASSLKWIGCNCQSVIHNAASLTFHNGNHQAEPWLSNVEGTRHVLELCRGAGIRHFHHVSTAYVCGLRNGRIMEGELDINQEFGNAYEQSKLTAEKMVRGADFLDHFTIYRPAIIIGDSATGYTTTFHGFYALLKLAHTLVSKVVLGSTGAQVLIAKFGLNGWERKNFVPVDWVAKVIGHIHRAPEHHGNTYHLTAPHPTPLSDMADVIQNVVEECSKLADPSDPSKCDGSWFEDVFKTQMEVYRSYWRNDPDFDCTNTHRAAPRLPCPLVDRNMLARMAKFAIQTNFGKVSSRVRKPDFYVCDYLQHLFQDEDLFVKPCNGEMVIGLQVDGPGGGQWEFQFPDDRSVKAEAGITSRSKATVRLNSTDFLLLANRQISVKQAFQTGSAHIEGNGSRPLANIQSLLETIISSCRLSDLTLSSGVS